MDAEGSSSSRVCWRAIVIGIVGAVIASIVGPVPTVASANAAPSYADVVIADNPDAFYRFEEGAGSVAIDSSGHDRDMSFVSTPTWESAGVDGSGAVLVSGGNYIDGPGLGYHNSSLTVEAWVKTSNTDGSSGYDGNAALTVFGDNTNDVWFSFGVHDGKARVSRYSTGSNSWQHVSGATVVADGDWHHIVATLSQADNTGTLYVDGYADGIGTLNVYATDRASVRRIGAGYANGDTFDGQLDELAIYSSVLSASDVLEHFEAAGGTAGQEPVVVRTPVASYSFDETSGSSIADGVGSADGTVEGAVGLTTPGVVAGSSTTGASFGPGAFVSVPPIEFPGESFSVEAWVKTSDMSSGGAYGGDPALPIVADRRGTVWFTMGIDNGAVRLARHGAASGSWQVLEGSSLVADGEWHQVVVTTSSDGIASIYVDGTLDAQDFMEATGDDLAAVEVIGRGYNAADSLNGDLDELAVYSGVLTPAEVRQRYTDVTGQQPGPRVAVVGSPLITLAECIGLGGNVYLDLPVVLEFNDDGGHEYPPGCYWYESCVDTFPGLAGDIQSWVCDNQVMLITVLAGVALAAGAVAVVTVCVGGGCAIVATSTQAGATTAEAATGIGSGLLGGATLLMLAQEAFGPNVMDVAQFGLATPDNYLRKEAAALGFDPDLVETCWSEGLGHESCDGLPAELLPGGINGNLNSDGTFNNIYPDDSIQSNPAIVDLDSLRWGDGVFNYVVTHDGQLIVGEESVGHITLAGKEPVLAGGEIAIFGGEVSWINNRSGHYLPYGETAKQLTLDAFAFHAGLVIDPWMYDELK